MAEWLLPMGAMLIAALIADQADALEFPEKDNAKPDRRKGAGTR